MLFTSNLPCSGANIVVYIFVQSFSDYPTVLVWGSESLLFLCSLIQQAQKFFMELNEGSDAGNVCYKTCVVKLFA